MACIGQCKIIRVRSRIPLRVRYERVEADVLVERVLEDERFPVGVDLGLGGVIGGPVGVEICGEGVEVRGDITSTALEKVSMVSGFSFELCTGVRGRCCPVVYVC